MLLIFTIKSGHVANTREQLLIQTQQLAQRRSEKPPKLPPRDNMYPHDIPKVNGVFLSKLNWFSHKNFYFFLQPDYDDIHDEDTRMKPFKGKSDKGKDHNKKYGK